MTDIVTNMDIVPLLLKKGERVVMSRMEGSDVVEDVLIGITQFTDNALLLSVRNGELRRNQAKGISTFNDLNLSRHDDGYWELH